MPSYLAYTMFNVYLPKMLEMNSGASDTVPKTLEDTMWQVVIFTLAGCPGAIVSHFDSVFSFKSRSMRPDATLRSVLIWLNPLSEDDGHLHQAHS